MMARITSSVHDDKHYDPVNVQSYSEIEAVVPSIDEVHDEEQVVQDDEELKIYYEAKHTII